jgi:pimeloyl-ACP methyl ester carboxylesterase
MPAFSLTFPDLAGLAGLLLLSLALLWCWCVGMTAWVLTHPPRRTYANALARGRPGDPGEVPPLLTSGSAQPPTRVWTEWSLTLPDVTLRLPVWDVTGQNPAGPTVIMLHGWGDSRIGALPRLQAAEATASRVLILESRGHGEAPGITALGTREVNDVSTLLEVAGVKGDVHLWGWSMGAGIALAAAASAPEAGPYAIRGVFAESVYRRAATPAANVMLRSGVPTGFGILACALKIVEVLGARGVTSASFDRAGHGARASQRNVTLTFLHGTHDEISPLEDARSIVETCRAGHEPGAARTYVPVSLHEIQGAGHHGIWTDPSFAPLALHTWHSHLESTRLRSAVPRASA